MVAAAIARMDAALEVNPPGRAVSAALSVIAERTAAYASEITHRDTNTLYRSYRKEYGQGTSGAFATIYVDPSVVNPRGAQPAVYAAHEFNRGGDHDAFGRATARANSDFVQVGIRRMLQEAARAGRQQ